MMHFPAEIISERPGEDVRAVRENRFERLLAEADGSELEFVVGHHGLSGAGMSPLLRVAYSSPCSPLTGRFVFSQSLISGISLKWLLAISYGFLRVRKWSGLSFHGKVCFWISQRKYHSITSCKVAPSEVF